MLTDPQRAELEEPGHLRVPGFVGDDAVAAMQAAVWAFLRTRGIDLGGSSRALLSLPEPGPWSRVRIDWLRRMVEKTPDANAGRGADARDTSFF